MLNSRRRIRDDPEGHIQRSQRVGFGLIQTERFCLAKVDVLQGFFVNCGPSLDIEEGEVIDHAEKLSPQEQCATAFGFVTLNPPFWRSSL